ncbi:MAG TPA: hypothetical protein VGR78_07895 [Verrucomicrobiae bacterium]|jgi:hypothetical protein|nr:hypothetical protein [Verrucomicrobiae bacterium]
MKQITALKLSVLAASVAAFGMGCASTGYARNDANTSPSMGVSASAETGTGYTTDRDLRIAQRDEGEARMTVSALSFSPETRANWVNRFPFYDRNLVDVETYTFAVPDRKVEVASQADLSGLPEFSVNLPPGSVFVESAGGAGEVRTGRVIQHSPNPMR